MDTGRKVTGGKYHANRKKRLYSRRNTGRAVVLGETTRKQMRVRGGAIKTILLKSNTANILVEGNIKKTEIVNVEETPQNRFLARQNRLMKGAIILTGLGKARITNRPTQEGQVNASLIKEQAKQ